MLNKYQSQGHSLTLVEGHSGFKVKTQVGDLEPKFIRKFENRNEN